MRVFWWRCGFGTRTIGYAGLRQVRCGVVCVEWKTPGQRRYDRAWRRRESIWKGPNGERVEYEPICLGLSDDGSEVFVHRRDAIADLPPEKPLRTWPARKTASRAAAFRRMMRK